MGARRTRRSLQRGELRASNMPLPRRRRCRVGVAGQRRPPHRGSARRTNCGSRSERSRRGLRYEICMRGAPISTGSSRWQIYGEEAKGGSATCAYAREKAAALSRGCQMPAMENPYRAFVATAADLICGVRSGVRHCRSASVLLFMVRSSPRPLGEGADPTASDELTLCAWHLAGERTRRVRAPSLRGVLAEAQEPPG